MMTRKKRLRSLRLLASRHQRLHGFASQRSIRRRLCTGSASPQGNRSPSFKYFQTCYSKSFTKLASKFKISFLCTTAVIVVERIDVRNINVSIFQKNRILFHLISALNSATWSTASVCRRMCHTCFWWFLLDPSPSRDRTTSWWRVDAAADQSMRRQGRSQTPPLLYPTFSLVVSHAISPFSNRLK